MRSSWIRLGIPIALLLACAIVAGTIAWREANRARATAHVLMKDYASFIAGKFVELSADRYRFLIGILSRFEDDGSPFALLRSFAGARAGGRSAELPQPNQPVVDYFFLADTTSGTFKISGRNPPERERDILFELVSGINTRCSPNQLIPIGHLASLQSAEGKSSADSFPWSGLFETDERGDVLRICGLRLDLSQSVDRFLAPVITDPDDCHCTSGLLPASLAGIEDIRRAASFILRDAERKVVYSTQPRYNGAGVVQDLSPDLPFAGWSIEVAINPAVVQPFLPYAGRGTPWFVLALVGCLILGSGALAFAALRGESQLFRLRQDFISNVSHELRTPLTRVRLFNELLMAGGQSDSEKSRHYRKVIDRECRRLTILIDNILDFSRLERGARKYGKTAVDLRATLEDALESFRTASDEGRFRLESFLEPVGLVVGDPQAL